METEVALLETKIRDKATKRKEADELGGAGPHFSPFLVGNGSIFSPLIPPVNELSDGFSRLLNLFDFVFSYRFQVFFVGVIKICCVLSWDLVDLSLALKSLVTL